MKTRLCGIALVCLLLFGAVAIQARENSAGSTGQATQALQAAERAYERVMELCRDQEQAPVSCYEHLRAARNALDDAVAAQRRGNAHQAQQMAQESMALIREGARCLDAVPEQAGAMVAEQYRRIEVAYVRMQGASAMLGAQFGEMPVLNTQLALIGDSIALARAHMASGEYTRMGQALRSAAQGVKEAQDTIREAVREYRYGAMADRYRTQMQENYQKTLSIIIRAKHQGIDVTEAQALLEQLRAGAGQAAGHRQGGNMQAYRKALSDLTPIGEALREELALIAQQITE